MTKKTIIRGAAARTFQTPAKLSATRTNPDKIFSKACPAVMFANSRTDKLITLERVETNSIKMMKGVMTKGDPLGKKWLKAKILLSAKP